MNQRDHAGKILRPSVRVPVLLMSDFLKDDGKFPLTNLSGDAFGTYFSLLVGRGSHSRVIKVYYTSKNILKCEWVQRRHFFPKIG